MHVVLAEPSRTIQKAVTKILNAAGHTAEAFSDGNEALARLRSDERVGALITSTAPLGISGVELCWEARLIASAGRPIYVIMMSSHRDRKTLCEALDGGADDFIEKIPAAEELHARMRAAERLACMERDLVRLATTDPLTGVLNRRAFFEGANAAAERAARGTHLSCVMLDIDHFKRINDTFGHQQGDEALCAVSQIAMAAAQKPAILGRLGGEEFAFILPQTTAAEAAALSERLRAEIAALRQNTRNGVLAITCSFGVSDWRPGDDIDTLLRRADAALYLAKSNGRNRVVLADYTITGARNASGVDSDSRPVRFRPSQNRTFRILASKDGPKSTKR